MKFVIFTTLFLTLFALICIYISKRLIAKLDLNKKIKIYINIFLAVNYLGVIGYMFARYYGNVDNWLYFLLSSSIGLLFLFFCTALIYDISLSCLDNIPLSQSRRKFFKRSLDLFSLGLAATLSARSLYEAKFVQIENVNIKIKNLKQPYKITQLSDIHIGGLIDAKFVKSVVKKVNLLKPDIVVITGDLIDVDLKYAKEALLELTKLNSTFGTYFIAGNHEYFHDLPSILKTVESIGIKTLKNENLYIGKPGYGFNLAGVYDIFGYRIGRYKPNLQKALLGKKDSPTVLLAHQPRYIEEIKSGVDLMLSGHTHGGQIYPFKFLVKLHQPYISGLHTHNKNLQIYVNIGTGFWGPPMRLGATAQISDIVIQPS